MRWLVLLLLLAAPLNVSADELVRAELVSETLTVTPGQPFTVALKFSIVPGWHTYWRNPGDAGLPTKLAWTSLPDGFTVSDLQWPPPQRFINSGLTSYGYANEAWHLVTVTPPEKITAKKVSLSATAEWLVCADTCVPGDAKLSLTLTVSDQAKPSLWFNQIQQVKKSLPIRDDPPTVSAGIGYYTDRANAKYNLRNLCLSYHKYPFTQTPVFFPYGELSIKHDRISTTITSGPHCVTAIPLAENSPMPQRVQGIIVSDTPWDADGHTALEIDVPLTVSAAPADAQHPAALPLLLALAFLGGLVLNLMPCVFPVLAVKILGFIHQAGQDKKQIIRHALAFSGGVLVSFWLLAGALIALRAGGQQLGWGFQLQSPAFVYALTVILFLFGLNLSGVFEFGVALTGLGAGRVSNSGLTGSFFSGVLATVVATPCAAPFLATALGAALTLNPAPSLLLFTAIALGLAAPYLIISACPRLLNCLPKPGAWMLTLKQLLAFPLYASAAWLLWVLAAQVSGDALLKILLSLTVIAFAAWLLGHGQQTGTRWRQWLIAAGAILMAASAFHPYQRTADDEQIRWQPWSPEAVEQARADGHPVYVDFTARWCATCQTNKALVFGSKAVREKFRELGVVTLSADWTNRDPRITQELARHGKSAVPFTLLYLPADADPIALPELLTPQTVLGALSR